MRVSRLATLVCELTLFIASLSRFQFIRSSISLSPAEHIQTTDKHLCDFFVLLLQHGDVWVTPFSVAAAVPALGADFVVFSCSIKSREHREKHQVM